MGKIEDLNAKADELQAAVDTLQAKVEAGNAADAATIAALQALIDQPQPASNEQIQAVIDKLEASRVDIENTP